jgi:hypothetical protein
VRRLLSGALRRWHGWTFGRYRCRSAAAHKVFEGSSAISKLSTAAGANQRRRCHNMWKKVLTPEVRANKFGAGEHRAHVLAQMWVPCRRCAPMLGHADIDITALNMILPSPSSVEHVGCPLAPRRVLRAGVLLAGAVPGFASGAWPRGASARARGEIHKAQGALLRSAQAPKHTHTRLRSLHTPRHAPTAPLHHNRSERLGGTS